jgi:type I restriction enzyme S subunit
MTMNRYPSYKPTGVKWLGEIPSHWEMKRWRFLMSENTTKNSNCKERLQLQFRYGDIVRKSSQSEESDVLDTISKYTIVEPDDIMINGLNLNYDFISQRVAQVQEHGVITSAYISLRPTEIANSRYFTYFLKSMDAKKMFHGMGTGIRLTLSYNELKNQFIPCPSPDEQSAIAAYLDTATAKIDVAIAQQQKMIDLLNERKQIIINRAVTKGLNPNAKMKDSGVEWIGEVPEDWEVRKLKHIAKLQSGDTISSDSFTEDGYPVYGGNGFRGYTNRYTNDGDYVLIGRQGALCGNVNYAHGQFFASEHAVVVYPYHKENLIWLGEVIRTSNLNQYSQSAAQPGLAVSMIQNISYPYPPENEKNEIASFLKNHLSQIDMAIANCQKQISLLQERKQIIINEVVTGKVKVV